MNESWHFAQLERQVAKNEYYGESQFFSSTHCDLYLNSSSPSLVLSHDCYKRVGIERLSEAEELS